jgi:integrase
MARLGQARTRDAVGRANLYVIASGLRRTASRNRGSRVSVQFDKRTGKHVVRWRRNGRHYSRSFTVKGDAERFDREQKRAKELGALFDPRRGSQTVAEVIELWWASHVLTLQRNTRDGYRVTWAVHIRPQLGDVLIRDLTPGRVDAFREGLTRSGVGDATVAKSLAVLSGVCRFAVLRGLIDANPVREVRTPRPRRSRFVVAATPVTVECVRVVLIREGRLRDAVIVSTLSYAGLRPGEALALRWSDVRRASLVIERAVAKGEIKATKNERLRAVRLLPPLAYDLALWRGASERANDDDYVFPNSRGAVWGEYDWDNWRDRVFRPAVDQAGVVIGRPYDLRHSFASLLIHEGRSLADVAVQIGDAVATVAGTYAHAFIEAEALPREPAADVIEAAREALEVRRLYVDTEFAEPGDASEPASELEADARTRTGDPFITSEVLYQLSYVGEDD